MSRQRYLDARIGMLTVLGAVTVGLTALAPAAEASHGIIGYVICLLVAGVVAYAATVCARDAPQVSALVIIVIVALICRVMVLGWTPLLSTDVYRYVWDSRVQGAGINPYLYIPADSHLAFLRDNVIYPNINRANYAHTAYPPFAEMFFYLATRVSDTLLSMRMAFALCGAGTMVAIYLLLKKMQRPPALLIAYAWHPLAIWETVNGAHIDALVTFLVVLSMLALTSGRRLVGVVLVAFSVLAKPYAVILLPAFWRRWEWRSPVLLVAVVVALYVPYLGAGKGVIGFLPGYFKEEGLASGNAFWLVLLVRRFIGDLPGIEIAYVLTGLVVFAYLSLRMMRKARVYDPVEQYRDAMILLVVGLFFLSPNYAWYYLPLVPFVALGGGPTLWAMTLGAIVLHPSSYGLPSTPSFLLLQSIMNIAWILTLLATLLYRRRRREHLNRALT